MTHLTLIPTPPEAMADQILDQACKVAARKFRAGLPETGRFIIEAAYITAEDVLAGGASC